MNTTKPRVVAIESIGDLPVLWVIFERIGLVGHIDRHFPASPHWKGPLTTGEVVALWLLFIISRADHRLSHVQPWAEQNQGILSALVGKPVRPNDLHDDRLADFLTRFGTD